MDNDLMARRLRPPSEPAQPAFSPAPFTLPEYEAAQAVPTLPEWPPAPPPGEELAPPPISDVALPWDSVADETPAAAHEGAVAYELSVNADYESPVELESTPPYEAPVELDTPAPYEPPPWSPQARDEVPWDRPSDYEQPTDTATADQLSWDRPEPGFWADPDAVDDTMVEVFEPDAGVDRPELPPWPPSTSGLAAAVASTRVDEAPATPVAASDPDDAYAPVLGDIQMPTARAWPEMNGHDAGRNDATVAAEAVAQAQAPSTAPAQAESVEALADARADWDEPTGSVQSWPDPGPEETNWTPDPDPAPVPAEWDSAAVQRPDGAAAEPEPEYVTDPETAAEPEPEFVAEPETAAEPEPEFVAEPETAAEPEPEYVTEPEPPLLPAVAPEPMSNTPHQPLVVRIELAIVDDSIHIVGPADAVWRVNDVNAVVLDLGESGLASEAERLTPRHPSFEPRALNSDGYQADSAWLEPSLPSPSADTSIPAATLNPPWLEQAVVTQPEALSVRLDRGPDAAPWPAVTTDSAAVPPASPLPLPWGHRNPTVDPLDARPSAQNPAQPEFGSPRSFAPPFETSSGQGASQSAFAAPVYVERELTRPGEQLGSASAQAAGVAVQEQSDLWFLSTEPADIDDTSENEVVVVRESSWKMALWTIGFAILVLFLVLVFIQTMTALLG